MIRTTEGERLWRVRMLPKDLGVALVLLAALGLALLLRGQVEGRTTTFQAADAPFSISYPATWGSSLVAEQAPDILLTVEDPLTDSTFKTRLSVENTLLDPASPPDLATLVNRRIDTQDDRTGYHFIGQGETTVAGAPARQLEYAYVAQPIDTPGRPALPVVVHTREYVVQAGDAVYYITLAAPESEFAEASARFDRILQTVSVQ
jgi:hypothetical protein